MSDVRITPRTKTIYHTNKITGNWWTTQKVMKGFEVNGGFLPESYHATLKSAEKEKACRIAMNEKFPFVPPRSEREIKKAKRLGLRA